MRRAGVAWPAPAAGGGGPGGTSSCTVPHVLANLAGPLFELHLAGKPGCADNADSFCSTVYHTTHIGWLAASSEWLLIKPFRVLLIVLGALLVRWIMHRMIKRFTRLRADDARPTLLRPLKERVNLTLRESGVLSERRRQRAATLASVLRNIVSIVVFSIAALMIVSELGVDLAPLLASAGIAGVALGFGAQTLVKDAISGMFMLLEDQYGVGDLVDFGEATGTVESVGLRITTIRDGNGVLWYIRNGEVVRVGNRSQSWAMVIIDVPVGFGASVGDATAALDRAVAGIDTEENWSADVLEPPAVLGVQEITNRGSVLRVQVKTTADGQWRVGRELRRRITGELDQEGISAQLGTRLALDDAPER